MTATERAAEIRQQWPTWSPGLQAEFAGNVEEAVKYWTEPEMLDSYNAGRRAKPELLAAVAVVCFAPGVWKLAALPLALKGLQDGFGGPHHWRLI